MDLNDLYFRHQISLMRAKSSGDDCARGKHQVNADELASRIGHWQTRVGAGAASMWVRVARGDVAESALS